MEASIGEYGEIYLSNDSIMINVLLPGYMIIKSKQSKIVYALWSESNVY